MKLKKLAALSLVAAMMLSLAACGGKAEETTAAAAETEAAADSGAEAEDAGAADEDLPVLKVAVMPFLNSLPIKYMVENGIDVENGFKVETVYFANGNTMNEALAAEEWEVGTLSAAAVNSLAIYGAYCVADVAHSEGGLFTLAPADSPIAAVKGYNPSYPDVYGDPETVSGITIATTTGTVSHLNVIKWLEALGMTTEDVNLVNMDFPSSYQALQTGNCDVAALNPPTSFQAESEGYLVTSSLSTLDVPQYDSIICSKATYENRKDVVEKYIKAFYQANDALQADPDMAAELLLEWYTENGSASDLEACKTEIETRPFVTTDEAKTIVLGESVQITGEFWVSQELLDPERFPDIATHVDDSLVKNALGF